MAILKVAQMGHPVLRERAADLTPAEIRSEEIQRLIDDMLVTMREYQGVGLAAPQVHAGKRIAVIESHKNPRYPGAPEFGMRVLINPVVTPLETETIRWWEGCLSIPGIRGLVHRPRKIRVESLDRGGAPQHFEAEGFSAVVIQHELDHLDGVLYLDRMTDLTTLSYQREYEQFWAPAEATDAAPDPEPSREAEA